MAKADVKAEISPATAALVVLLVLAMSAFSLWHFVINQPPLEFTAPVVAPSPSGESRAPSGTPASPARETGKPGTSEATEKPGT